MILILKLIIIFLIIIPIASIYIMEFIMKHLKKEQDEIHNILIVISGFLISAVLLIAVSAANQHYREYKPYYTQKIVALEDNHTTVVSRYSSNASMYYHFMVDKGDHIKPRKVNQNYSIIKYTNKQPKLVVYKKEATNAFLNWVMPVTYIDDYKYEFYVPKGTIKQNINIDLN